MKNTKVINIDGYDFVLSERVSYDVRELEDYVSKHQKKLSRRTDTALLCIKIIDAMKTTYKAIKLYQLKTKFIYFRAMRIKWLMKKLSDTELVEYCELIDELEDYEKKKTLRQAQHQPDRSAA
jgi:RAB protein geranylgeranyltransferase component A